MKLKYLLSIALLLFSSTLFAQVTKESYDKAIDYLNCKLLEASLNGKEEMKSKLQKECPCKTASFGQINKFITNAKLQGEITASTKAIEDLKIEFNQQLSKNQVINYLSEELFNDSSNHQKIFKYYRKAGVKADVLKVELRNEFDIILVESKVEPTLDQTSTSSTGLSSSSESATPTEASDFFQNPFKWIGFIALFLSIVAIVISLIRTPNIELIYNKVLPKVLDSERLKGMIQSNTYPKNLNIQGISANEFKVLYDRVVDLEIKLKELSDELERSTSSSTTKVDYASPVITTNYDNGNSGFKSEILYLSTPNIDGSFNNSSSLAVPNDTATIYKFTVIGPNKAQFVINERESSYKLALQYPDKSIDPACNPVNAFNSKASRIITERPGYAELQDGKWIIKDKATIRYES